MVEDANANQVQRLFQRMRQVEVGATGFHGAGRVVVGQHHAGGIVREGRLDHFAWIDAGMRQGAAKQFICTDQAILDVQE